jgi:tetratricopeptide (TPR) repeat protein
MKTKKRAIFVFLILISLSHFMFNNVSAQNVAEWRQDIDILTAKIEQYHPAPWAKISKEAFIGRAEEIKTNLQEWNKERIILEMMKLVALLRDGHTKVLFSNQDNFNLWFPIRIEKFHDGLFITGTDIENAGLLGANVLRMGKQDAASAYSRVGTIIATDSDHGIARLATNYLSNAVILKTLGIIDSQRFLPLEVLLQDGLKKEISVESAQWRMLFSLHYHKTRVPTNNEIKTIFDDKLDSLPLYLSRVIPSRVPYWFEYIPDDKMIYLQYNNVTNWNKEPFRDFTKRLFKAYDKHISKIDKFVIDVRFNSGGNGYLLPPFVREFALRDDSFTRGKLYIITGRDTFSAASNFIGRMLKNTSAITVGDIAAGPLNWCSDTTRFDLPNSHLMANISTMFWQQGHATDTRGYYPPDYYMPTKSTDYFSCSDPVLEAIKNNEAKCLKDILFYEGADKFKAEFHRREKLYGPAEGWFPYTSFDSILYTYFTLMPADKINEALEILRLNTVIYPDDFRAWYALAEINEENGKLREAMECYDKLLSIEPHIPEVRRDYHNLILLDTFNDQGIAALARSYKNLKKSNPNEINEHTLNTLGYSLLRNNRIQESIEVFKLNVEIHSEYANGYDSLGEAYMKAGENELAIKNYQKSLELDPGNDNAKEMLKVLRKK